MSRDMFKKFKKEIIVIGFFMIVSFIPLVQIILDTIVYGIFYVISEIGFGFSLKNIDYFNMIFFLIFICLFFRTMIPFLKMLFLILSALFFNTIFINLLKYFPISILNFHTYYIMCYFIKPILFSFVFLTVIHLKHEIENGNKLN